MKIHGVAVWRAVVFGACVIVSGASYGQVVINEVVNDERTAGSTAIDPDTREFVELYNAGSSAVDIGEWQLVTVPLAGGPPITDTLPPGTMLGAGEYFVFGAAGVPNVDYTPPGTEGIEIFADSEADVLELRNSVAQGSTLIDALGYEIYRSGLGNATSEQIAQISGGYYGQVLSTNVGAPNSRASLARYVDGRDSNNNGYDFGILPLTPGTTNNLPQNASHTIPDVDALSAGSELGANYYASFVLPTVINPTNVDGNNPRSIPASPQGGNAIVAWDSTGGGNAVYSKELVHSFDLYAYIDTTPLGVGVETSDEEWETSIYGIGSTDSFFASPDPTGGIFVPDSVLANGSTGIGWMIQQYEDFTATGTAPDFTKLVLVDFGDGGNSYPGATPAESEWKVIQEIDLSTMAPDWYRLGIDYDPATGEVTATFDDQTFTFTTSTDLLGNFFVGYREGITDDQTRLGKLNPPIYDLFDNETPTVLAGDYNNDGTVNAADYTVWRDNLGASIALDNETVTPGMVTAEDYTEWKSNFGATNGGGASQGSAAVPEPTSLALTLVAAMAFLGAARSWRE